MNLVADDTAPSLRRAALALHALSPADRAWVLGQLTKPQQQALQPLLAELVELGIPPDAQLVRQVLTEQGARPAAARPAGAPHAAALRGALQAEPAAMQPYLLAALPAAQREAVLAQGFHVPSSTVVAPLPAALRESLERALHARALSPSSPS